MGEVMRKVLIVLGVSVALVGIVIGVLATGLEGSERWWPISWMAWAPVGAVILWKRPGNGVGLTLLAIGVSWGLSFIALAIAIGSSSPGVRAWGELVSDLFGVVPWLGVVWLLLVFPTGRLVGLLERLTAAGVVGLAVLALLSFALSSVPMDTTGLESPLAVPALDSFTSWLVSPSGFAIVPVLAVAAVASLLIRWRASTGVERHQFRWLVLGSSFYVLVLVVGQLTPDDNPFDFLWIAAGTAIPVVIGVAVLRYRLYEIDRIVSRTVAYALVVVLLGAVFAAGVVGIPNLVSGIDGAPPLVVAASTLAAAALFNPVRRRVLVSVDRRFNRSRYDSARVMDEFALTLRDRVDSDGLVSGWLGVVTETMQPSVLGVWMRQ